MRILILVCASLAVAACGGKTASDNSTTAGENAASEAVVTNDVTAIDAATGEAANMAPDVNYTFDESNLENGTNTSNHTATRRPAQKATKPTAPQSNLVEAAPDNTNTL